MKLPVKPRAKEIDTRKFVFTLYGVPKAGKTTFASQFLDAIFIATEAGTKFVEVNQVTDDNGEPTVIKTWKEFKEAVKMLITQEHPFKTVVIDTVDNAADLCTRHVNAENGWHHESAGEYGKGSALIKREFKAVIDALLASGMGVVFITHEKQSEKEDRGVKRPFTDVSLGNTFKNYITGSSDFIFYAFRNSKGERLMLTKATDNVNAGDRSGKLPAVMPLDFNLMIEALKSQSEPTKE
jgi:hypothetical protein